MKSTLVQLILLATSLSACSSPDSQLQTMPTSTPRPAATSTDMPPATSEPEDLKLGELFNIGDIFSFNIIESYRYEVLVPSILFSDFLQDLNYQFLYFDSLEFGPDPGRAYLSRMYANFSIEPIGDPTESQVDGLPAEVIDFTGEIQGSSLAGRFTTVSFEDGDLFVAFGMGYFTDDVNRWENEGRQAYELMLENLQFGPNPEAGSACSVALDPNYGYSETDPIKIGGATLGEPLVFSGPSRERAYIRTLRGPNGELVEFDRAGSQSTDDTIVDIYTLTVGDTVYIDFYHYEAPLAPMGFTCGGPFPFSPD